jgi:hypothetical protein
MGDIMILIQANPFREPLKGALKSKTFLGPEMALENSP